MRWWRVRPSEDRTSIVAEYAPDGTTYTTLGVSPTAAPDAVRPEIALGTFAAEPTAGTAIAPAGAEADDALLDALAAISVDHAFIDHALDQLTGSVDLFDVPSLHSGVSSDFFGPDNTG